MEEHDKSFIKGSSNKHQFCQQEHAPKTNDNAWFQAYHFNNTEERTNDNH